MEMPAQLAQAGAGEAAQLALDSRDWPTVAWGCGRMSRDYEVEIWDGVAWRREYPDQGNSFPLFTGIAAVRGAGDRLTVSVVSNKGHVRAARETPPGWTAGLVEWDSRNTNTALALDAMGEPVLAYGTWSLGTAFASAAPVGWVIEEVDPLGNDDDVALAWAPWNGPCVAYGDVVGTPLRYACRATVLTGQLYRGTVACLSGNWREVALPLGPGNDDETLPFPASAIAPGRARDPLTASAPLVLYTLSTPGNALRIVDPTWPRLSY